jgi:hypothetical protein
VPTPAQCTSVAPTLLSAGRARLLQGGFGYVVDIVQGSDCFGLVAKPDFSAVASPRVLVPGLLINQFCSHSNTIARFFINCK